MVIELFAQRSLCLASVPGAVHQEDLGMDNKPQGYDLDETNARGALNHSSLRIIEASELVLPLKGWYPGREYYIITKGLEVGVYLDMSVLSLATRLRRLY